MSVSLRGKCGLLPTLAASPSCDGVGTGLLVPEEYREASTVAPDWRSRASPARALVLAGSSAREGRMQLGLVLAAGHCDRVHEPRGARTLLMTGRRVGHEGVR